MLTCIWDYRTNRQSLGQSMGSPNLRYIMAFDYFRGYGDPGSTFVIITRWHTYFCPRRVYSEHSETSSGVARISTRDTS